MTSNGSPNSSRWFLSALGLIYLTVMMLVIGFPWKNRDKAMATRPIAVRTDGFLRETIALGSEGINQSIALPGNLMADYKKGRFVSFPGAELTNPPYSSGGWRINGVYYSAETVFLFGRGDITLIQLDGPFPGVADTPIRLWDQNPTIEEE